MSAMEPRAFESLLRFRTSPGLETKGYYVGHFGRLQRGDYVAGPVFYASSTLSLEISVTSKCLDDWIDGHSRPYAAGGSLFYDACKKAATLFTECAGRRRICVHTVFIKMTRLLKEVFSDADVVATAPFVVRNVSSVFLVSGISFSKVCEAVKENTSQTFYVYQDSCMNSPASGQVIVPESYKAFSCDYIWADQVGGFEKEGGVSGGRRYCEDKRESAGVVFFVSGSIEKIAVMCYPCMWEVQKVDN